MKEIAVSKFKEKCLALLDSLDEDGLLITKHGKPLARVVPIHVEYAEMIGSLKGKIEVRGDILSTGLSWNAES